jgi:hypothetical protein
MAKISMVCRVCGLEFTAPRYNAVTCTDTCRQRLWRGQAFAYLDGLSPARKRAERKRHARWDELVAAHKRELAEARTRAELRRELRQQRAEQERERFIAETVGRAYLADQNRNRELRELDTVAGILKLFAQERRNDMSAEAIAEFLSNPYAYPVEAIASALEQLRASGDYDRIVNEATSPPATP